MRRIAVAFTLAIAISSSAAPSPVGADARIHPHRPAAIFTITLSLNGKQVGEVLSAPSGATAIRAHFPASKTLFLNGTSVKIDTYAVATFSRNGAVIGKPALLGPRVSSAQISELEPTLHSQIDTLSAKSGAVSQYLYSSGGRSHVVSVPLGSNAASTILSGPATYGSFDWLANGKKLATVSLTGLAPNGLTLAGTADSTTMAVAMKGDFSRGGLRSAYRLSPSGADGIHLHFLPARSVAGISKPTYVVISFTRNGALLDSTLSRPRHDDLEISVSCCPLQWSVTISLGSSLSEIPVPAGTTAVGASLYGGATVTSFEWTQNGRAVGKANHPSDLVGGPVYAVNLNSSKSNAY